MPETFNPHIAHITAADGTVFQVLNDAEDDWDEAATRAEYQAWLTAQAPAQPVT